MADCLFLFYPIQLPLVLLVIGTIVTTIYVAVILFLLQFQSKHTKALSLGTFFTCCRSFSRCRGSWVLNLISSEVVLSLAFSAGELLLMETKEPIWPLTMHIFQSLTSPSPASVSRMRIWHSDYALLGIIPICDPDPITSLVLVFLIKSRSKIYTRQFRRVRDCVSVH